MTSTYQQLRIHLASQTQVSCRQRCALNAPAVAPVNKTSSCSNWISGQKYNTIIKR
jgi:hypothetical protein